MKILLINSSPVVSRLLTLCIRDEHSILEEVERSDMIRDSQYDVLFVDESSYKDVVLDEINTLDIGKKIFLSQNDFESSDFDIIIKKPFLPSQIMDILESDTLEREVVGTSNTQVLNEKELEKIKALLEMDEEYKEIEELLSPEILEARKIEAIKAQLIAEGLEIVEEDEIIEGLEVDKELVVSFDNLKVEEKIQKNKKKSTKNKKKKRKTFSKKELKLIKYAFDQAMAKLKPKQKKKLLKGKEIEVKIKLEDKD